MHDLSFVRALYVRKFRLLVPDELACLVVRPIVEGRHRAMVAASLLDLTGQLACVFGVTGTRARVVVLDLAADVQNLLLNDGSQFLLCEFLG